MSSFSHQLTHSYRWIQMERRNDLPNDILRIFFFNSDNRVMVYIYKWWLSLAASRQTLLGYLSGTVINNIKVVSPK